jgi:acyl-coenzyme A thioesterase PaaI-like protein
VLTPLPSTLSAPDRSLAALARTRALGLHALGHFAGVVGESPAPGTAALELHPPEWANGGRADSPTESALLADLSLGTALRSALGPGLRLATIALTVDHATAPARGPLRAAAQADRVDHGRGDGQGRCTLRDAAGDLVATASGWFVAVPVPAGQPLPPVPWEDEERPVHGVVESDLDPTEAAVHADLAGLDERGYDRLVGPPTSAVPVDDGSAPVEYALRAGAALGNRVGQVQGGAQYGIAAGGARAAIGQGWEVATGHVQFLRPISAPTVEVEACVRRAGRSASFVDVTLRAAGREALTGRFTMRRAGG